MAISEVYTGATAVSVVEYSLTANSSDLAVRTTHGVYQAFLGLANLAAGDTYEYKCYEKVVSTSTASNTLALSARMSGAQGAATWVSPSLILLNGWEMTLTKISGTSRTVEWSIRKVSS